MKKLLLIVLLCVICYSFSIKAMMPLSGKTIIIDVGHGGKDVGTSYNDIYEKDINLSISLKLRDLLVKNGCNVLMTRNGDYDLSSPGARYRKKSDFDNRIKLINESKSDLYISIHTNYLDDSTYSGAQVFYYEGNDKLAESIQRRLNTISYPRNLKKMPDVYMYRYLKIKGVLIEVGFISNNYERTKLLDLSYQDKLALNITYGIIDYFN